jgi:molybdenum cofactor biosynthesis enzyme
MKNPFISFMTLICFSTLSFADNIEQTIEKKGHAVICAQTTGVLNVEKLHDEINLKIQKLKDPVILSVPTVSISLINVGDKNTTEPGALAVICVTVSKKK